MRSESSRRPVRNVLVMGAAGYQAEFVIKRLGSMFALRLFDRVALAAEHADLAFIQGDITDAEAVHRACRGQDAVVHMVAIVRRRRGRPPGTSAAQTARGRRGRPPGHSEETKSAIRRALEKGGTPSTVLARQYSVSRSSIKDWKRQWGLTKPRKKK